MPGGVAGEQLTAAPYADPLFVWIDPMLANQKQLIMTMLNRMVRCVNARWKAA